MLIYRKDIIKADFYKGKDVIFGKLESSKEDEKKFVMLTLSRINDHSKGPTIWMMSSESYEKLIQCDG